TRSRRTESPLQSRALVCTPEGSHARAGRDAHRREIESEGREHRRCCRPSAQHLASLKFMLFLKSVLLFTLAATVTFEEVPPSVSKITWTHNNAQSADRQLPETVGAGCAFLDYDNDGWMDIYFVNSGPSDFFTPTTPLKNALYHNNHDGTFT